MKKFLAVALLLILAPLGASAFFFSPGGSSGGGSTDASDLSTGTLPAARIADNSVTSAKLLDNTVASGKIADGTIVSGDIADNTIANAKLLDNTITPTKIQCTGTKDGTTYLRMDGACATPAGSGTVTGPATATQDNLVCWGADNVTIGDCGSATSDFAPASSTSTATDWNKWDGGATGLTAATGRTSLGLSSTDNVTFDTVTAGEFISSAADNTRGYTAMNSAAPTLGDLAAGKCWYLAGATSATDLLQCRNSDNTATNNMGYVVKTFSFGIDNVVAATDNILLTRVPRAWTITRADCYASTDNVVGNLMECATDNVTSCTSLDAWTVTNAVDPFTDSSMTDGAVAAGAWLRWSTTSVGTTNSNKLSCTVQYIE